MRIARFFIAAALLVGVASPAFADATAFIGTNSTPANRQARGFALGIGLLVVGFEFEYANTSEEPDDLAPGLRTGMGNILLQTPFAVFGLQPYFTTGGGAYRETLGTASETHFGLNTGGGVKISLFGPLRARADYRVFKLQGEPLHDTVHRVYAGVNLRF
jgi:opacity protein-like surface antigen